MTSPRYYNPYGGGGDDGGEQSGKEGNTVEEEYDGVVHHHKASRTHRPRESMTIIPRRPRKKNMVRAAPPGGAAGGKCWPGIPTKTAQTYVKNATGDDALLPDVEESRGRSRILPPSFTPLMKAAAAGWDATVERLLAAANRDNRAALLFEQDHKGRTACDWARIRGRHAIEETLKAAMDDEQQQREAEREAVNQRHNLESLVRRNLRLRALLEHAVCKHDVHEAARAVRAANFLRDDYDEAVATLRRYADVISKSNNNNEEEPAETEPLQLDETLYFIDIETKTGDTPLLLACAAGNELLAEDLIRRGAAVDHENSRGHSALTWACVCGSDRVVDMLLRSGADPSRRTKIDGRTPLLHAAQQGHARVLQVLVDRLFYDAQMARHEALNGERKLPDKEIALVTRNWLLEFEKALKHTDPKTKLCARELAASMGNDAALAVLTTAELRCEARSAELEQEESLKEEVACPRGCGDARVRRDAMTSHLLNDCDLRPAGCDYCGATLPLRGLEQHKNKECPSRHIRCETCEKDVPASLWKVHRQFRCPKRMIKCRQGCDLVLSADQLSYHELTRCRYRGKPCPLPGCGAEVPSCQLQHHVQYECPRRVVDCAVGCGQKIPFEEKDYHEHHVCKQECRWNGCGLRIGPTPRRLVHERVECTRRGMRCPHGCNAQDIAADTIAIHAEFLCGRRPLLCPNGCGWEGEAQTMGAHLEAESGNCQERHMRCRYDMLGRRIEYRPFKDSDKFERAVLRRFRISDGHFLLFGQTLQPYWASLAALDEVCILDNDTWSCGWIAAADMETHLANCCRQPYNVNQTGVAPQGNDDDPIPTIARDTSSELREQQKNGNQVVSIDRDEIPDDDDDDGGDDDDDDGETAVLQRRCKYGCGAAFVKGVEETLFAQHVNDECPKRPVTCVCGESSLWAEEIEEHKKVCRVLSCVEPRPGEMCKCGEYVAFVDRTTHLGVCGERECYCPKGCGEKIVARLLDNHIPICPRRHLHHGLLVPCPLGCGRESMQFQHKWAHVTMECPRRVIACTLGCSRQLLYCHLDEHLAICQQRMLPCGAGAEGCRRTLQSWMSPPDLAEGENGGRLAILVACDIHDATVLQLAVRQRDSLLLDYVLEMIENSSGDDLEHEGADGHNALTMACAMNWLECVEKLWRAGANLNRETRRGRTPLIEAAKAGSLDTCRFLVDRGAIIDQRSRHNTTAVDWAKKAGELETHRQLRRDMEVHQDMARLFTLVTLGETDAVEAIVKPGEPFKQGNLGRFIDELAFEDAAHESAHKSIVELTNEVREYKLEESVEIDKLRKRRQEAERIEKLADRALAVRVEAQQAVDAKLSRGARALQTIEAPDINELRSLRHDSVSKRVLRVLEACCELLCTNAADADVSKESDDDSRATASSAATFHKTARALTSASSMRKLDAEDHAQRWKVVRKVLLKDANLIQKLCFFTTRDVADPEALAHKIRTTYADDAHHLVDSVNDDEGEYNNLLLLLSERERDADAADAAADEVINKVAATAHSARCLRPAFNPEESNSPSNHEMVTFVIDGYELAGALAVWVNGHLAALESARVVVNLEHIETTLRSRFDMQRVPALESADQAAFRARNKQNIGNRELEQAREEEAYRRHRIKVCEGKVRVARVLQKYTQRGHSLLTWACALGNAHVAEVLIDHGSCPGLPDDVGSSAIRIIQLLYRHHRWRQAVREQRAQNQHPPSASEVASQRMREATFGFVLARQIALYSDLRVRARVPLCEAAYNGHERIFEIFKRRRILPTTHRSMLVTACRPQPPFPFAAKPDDQRDPQKKGRHLRVVSLPECVQLGRKELAHQHWQYGHAWIGADDRSGPRERTRMQASAAWSAYSRAQKYGARQQDSRVKHRAQKEKRDAAICDLVAAMFGGNFNRVSQLFDEGNVPVDYEDSSGMTPLIAAAGEDSAMESRIQSYDVEHKPVLAVVLLLDRRKRRPKVDAENRRGETAFCVACQKGRLDVAAALLERGANINFQSQAARQGWTPLRWTVEVNGRPATIDLLVERGAVVDERAEDGLTPVEAAIAHHHTDAAGALAKHRSGDVGLVVAELGVANKAFSCAFGCGAFFVRENDAAAHRETCSKKPVRCSECGDTELWAEELASHLKDTCPVARIVVCPLGCGESFRAENAANHAVICKYRVVTCSMCGVDVRETRIQVHQTYFCPSRPIPRNVKPERRRRRRNVRCPKRDSLVPKTKLEPPDAHARPTLAAVECPNRCGTRPRTCDLPTHLAKTCTRRWVECERCGVKVRRRDLERHLSCDAPLSVRCQLSAEPCPNKCGRSMPLRQLEVHQRFECARRAVPCGLCGMDVEAARASTHKDVECPMRSVECPNRLCYLRLPLANIKKHALLECKKRIVRCLQGCGERTFVKNLAKHHAECCTFRFVDCRLGCGKRLRAKDEWDHVERHCIRRSTANYVWGSNGQDITARKTQQQQSRL